MTTEERVSGLDLSELEMDNIVRDSYILIQNSGKISATKIDPYFLYRLANVSAVLFPMKGGLFRGMNLGTAVTEEQWNAIKSGSFEGLFLGDFWSIGGVFWQIVDFDYWWHCGANETFIKEHHAVVMPTTYIDEKPMNNSETTSTGYIGSDMYKTHLADSKAKIVSAFGSNHLMSFPDYYVNSAVNGIPAGMVYREETVAIPSTTMIYGSNIYASRTQLDTPMDTITGRQFSMYAICNRYFNNGRQPYWLRDIADDKRFAYKVNIGQLTKSLATQPHGVRPVFAIKG